MGARAAGLLRSHQPSLSGHVPAAVVLHRTRNEYPAIAMKSQSPPVFAVDVLDLLDTPGARRHVSMAHPLPELGTLVAVVPEDRPVSVECEVDHVVDGLLVSGSIAVRARLSCVRCLSDVDRELVFDVSELFTASRADDGDQGYAVLPGAMLPLDTMVRDVVTLGLPSTPRCREDCAGLCPQCGANRNEADCGHEVGTPDARWAPLATRLGDTQTADGGTEPSA